MEDEHGHEGETLWEEFWHIFTDPAHVLSEIAWHLIIELVIITLIYGIVIKKIIIPKLRKDIHKEIDKEHGYKHSDTE
jgi:uncharacterized membrane protein